MSQHADGSDRSVATNHVWSALSSDIQARAIHLLAHLACAHAHAHAHAEHLGKESSRDYPSQHRQDSPRPS